MAYDVEWHSEFLRDGDDGLLVMYRDGDEMATAIGTLVEEPDMVARLAASARACVLEAMEPATTVGRERALADDLLALKSLSRP